MKLYIAKKISPTIKYKTQKLLVYCCRKTFVSKRGFLLNKY